MGRLKPLACGALALFYQVNTMASNWQEYLDPCGDLNLIGDLADYVRGEGPIPVWKCWLSKTSPISTRKLKGRITYQDWVNNFKEKGLYIWLQPRFDGSGLYRFIHVGISATGGSTLGDRTKAHCRNQFKVKDPDRVHRLQAGCGEFGSLGEDKRTSQDRDALASDFVRKLKILFICPTGMDASSRDLPQQIRRLEGLIAYAASEAFSPENKCKAKEEKEITNTLGKTLRPEDERLLPKIRAVLNSVLPMMPV